MFPTEGFHATLSTLTPVLNRLRVRYHLTAGIAAVAYGEPRLTQDIDLVLHRSHRSRRDLRRILAGGTREELRSVEHGR